jgi:hypothetical protein
MQEATRVPSWLLALGKCKKSCILMEHMQLLIWTSQYRLLAKNKYSMKRFIIAAMTLAAPLTFSSDVLTL